MNLNMRMPGFKTSLTLMGCSGIVAQIVLLREFLVSFYGNELTLGIVLGNWLLLETIGSFAMGKSVEKTTRRIEMYVLFQLIFSMACPFSIYLCRTFKNLIGVTPGEGLGFITLFYSSFLILLPVSVTHGALFTYGSKIYSQSAAGNSAPIGKVYILETVGSIFGGLLASFLFIRYLNSFEIAFAISLANTLASLLLLRPFRRPPVFFRSGLLTFSVVFALIFAALIVPPVPKEINLSSVRSQWKGLNVVHNENSIYGNITVTKRGDQFTFFTDGMPSITVPVPDLASIEDLVHFSMLVHGRPESVLVLGGGAGGMIHEILKYPVTRVDYVELDPLLLKLVERYSTPLTQSELSDGRVKIHDTDGRFFVKRTQERFDLIFIGVPVPQELQTNRLFSIEFFSAAKERMKPDGMIVLTLPGSLTYVSPELRDLNRCIWNTLKAVYPTVRIIPGDLNIYLASTSDKLGRVTPGEVFRRLEEAKIKTNLFTKSYIEERLHERWMRFFLQSMAGKEIRINSDFRPLGVFFSLSYWNALFSPYLMGIFKWFEGLSLKLTLAVMAIFTFLLAAIFMKKPLASRHSLPYAIFTTGLTGMILNLAIIFSFQALYGYLYYQIGLLITTFMAGIAVSGIWITHRLDRIRNIPLLFLKAELFMILFALLFPLILFIPPQYSGKTAVDLFFYAYFLGMSFLSGALMGLQFPLATTIYLENPPKNGTIGYTAGLFYGADLLGGFCGGLFGGILLLPILGLKESCFMMAGIKISSGLLFFIFMKIHRAK